MTKQVTQASNAAMQQLKQMQQVALQRAGAVVEAYELPKKYTAFKAKVAEVLEPYQAKAVSVFEPYQQKATKTYEAAKKSATTKAVEVKTQTVAKVVERKKVIQTRAHEGLTKVYSYVIALVAWVLTYATNLFRSLRAAATKKVTQVYGSSSIKVNYVDAALSRVPPKVVDGAKKAAGFAAEKGQLVATWVKTTVVSRAESAVTWADGRLLGSRGMPAVKQLIADVLAVQQQQQKEKTA